MLILLATIATPTGSRAVLGWFGWRYGATQRECSAELGISRQSMCARVRALEIRGDLVKTATRRGGCVVYVVRT